MPVVPHPGQAQAELGGYFSLSSDASFQPRVYMVKSKIPGRQGLARRERRCCLYPAAVITPPNLESSGRAVPSATIRRLFNCSAIANCFPLPGSSCQHPAERREPHCKPRHAGSPPLPPTLASSEHRCGGDGSGDGGLGTPKVTHRRYMAPLGQGRPGRSIQPAKEPPKSLHLLGERCFLQATDITLLSLGLPFSCPKCAGWPQEHPGMVSPHQPGD